VAVGFEARDLSVAVLAEEEPLAAVGGQSIRALLAELERLTGVAAGVQGHAQAVLFGPAIDLVDRHIGEEQFTVLANPDRALRPVEAFGEQFHF
jgi:hypothetical protein